MDFTQLKLIYGYDILTNFGPKSALEKVENRNNKKRKFCKLDLEKV